MKKNIICILISLFLSLFLLVISDFPFYKIIELKLYDLRMILRPPQPQNEKIIYVEMDKQAIDDLGKWPWSRDIIANIVDTLKSLGAKQTIFDVTFSDHSPLSINSEYVDNFMKENGEKGGKIKDFIKELSLEINK